MVLAPWQAHETKSQLAFKTGQQVERQREAVAPSSHGMPGPLDTAHHCLPTAHPSLHLSMPLSRCWIEMLIAVMTLSVDSCNMRVKAWWSTPARQAQQGVPMPTRTSTPTPTRALLLSALLLSATPGGPDPNTSLAFQLHSRTRASNILLLDFTGHTTSGTAWNAAYTGGAAIVTPPVGGMGCWHLVVVTDGGTAWV